MSFDRTKGLSRLFLVVFCLWTFASGGKADENTDLKNSWNFYKKRVAEGAGVEERLFILEKMERLYAGKNLDLQFVTDEKNKIGHGAGYARGKITNSRGNSGTFVSALHRPASSKFSRGWSGFTWEAFPCIDWIGEAINLEVGMGYAFFPKMEKDDKFNEFKWTPLALKAKIAF